MKEQTETIKTYIAEDGKRFLNKDECQKYEDILQNVKFFAVRHNPDLAETGTFQSVSVVAVYSKYGHHKKIVENWCVKSMKWPIIGESVMGYGLQPHFNIIDDGYAKKLWNEFEKDKRVETSLFPKYRGKFFLSPIYIDGFPAPTNYMELWKLK